MEMFDKVAAGEKSICVLGLGYVGLPIALEFARKFNVVGFDINEERVQLMKQGIDPSKEIETESHAEALNEFRRQVQKRHPKLSVITGVMSLDGRVDLIG